MSQSRTRTYLQFSTHGLLHASGHYTLERFLRAAKRSSALSGRSIGWGSAKRALTETLDRPRAGTASMMAMRVVVKSFMMMVRLSVSELPETVENPSPQWRDISWLDELLS